MNNSPSYTEIKEYIDSIRLIDTHEHLPPEQERLNQKVDFLATFFPHYASSDLRSAGMSEDELLKIRNHDLPLDERWEIFEPWWEKIENTGYARAIEIAARDLYGVNGINSETYRSLTERIKEKNVKGLYRWVLKDNAGIDISINDTQKYDVDTEFFAPVLEFNEVLEARDRTSIESIGRSIGGSIHTLNDLCNAIKNKFETHRESVVGVKIPIAYSRPIFFEKTSFSKAEEAFNEIFKMKLFKRIEILPGYEKRVPADVGAEKLIPLQDYLIHLIVSEAERRKLPIQIHTGLHEGNENIVANSHPELLTNLFMEYKEAKFDIFHAGWPYSEELGALAKNFPNVYIDMCWMHIISPNRSISMLSNWLDEVPANKILGFGGDYAFVEGVYGHSVIARINIAMVLASKIDEGVYTMERAKKYARWLLRENAVKLFPKLRAHAS
jgi:predicted TIM-barrel fold metal-dependent hydrolase